jgi:predicted GH43/DUF377 family glycosyl hydrolase
VCVTNYGQYAMKLRRLGILMEPDPSNPQEAWGVLNPASARDREGTLLLYPRAVGEGNYSRIEIVRVEFSGDQPESVRREGLALEPSEPYERDHRAHGGVEDPRVTFVARLDAHVMAYAALGRFGPRIALAISKDARSWRRLGCLRFAADTGIDMSRCGNKDAALFPSTVKDRDGRDAFAILHRPTYLIHNDDGTVDRVLPAGVDDSRESIWISYVSVDRVEQDIRRLTHVHDSVVLAAPQASWESLKIGAGTPPMLVEDGWLFYYHGVSGREPSPGESRKDVCYQTGVMILDPDDLHRVLYRSAEPVLSPEHVSETTGIVPNVVFPTAVDVQGQTLFVFYGAADSKIGVATTTLESKILIAPSAPPPTANAQTGHVARMSQ